MPTATIGGSRGVEVLSAVPKPVNEEHRLEALAAYEILDTPSEQAYDDLALLAAQVCETPIALVNFIDGERQWTKASLGVELTECSRDIAFCSHTILRSEPLVVPDLASDARFAANPFVTGYPHVRFYAGAPLVTGSGMALGSLCAVDLAPRELRPNQREALAALARQVVAQLELRLLARRKEHQAMTDPLTGLGNRRKLMVDLEDAFGAPPDERRALVLFDLDGFKLYNDSYGHPAGDALLARLARRLDAAVSVAGAAYRIGGDEFCALMDVGAGADGLVEQAADALRERGEGFSVGSSHGQVLLREAQDATHALQLADERMYANKRSRSELANRQTHDVLVRILDEREPELLAHVRGVAELAREVGRRMRMAGEEIDELARAAELHDVGKVAIPDAILHKAGALSSDEWEFMRSHTLLGERILRAAPALRPVGRLVRASHERWDGGGYPDGLAGEEIPLGARIIFACDALNAMTTDRPYRTRLTIEDAVAELRRCAGTQFDAAVVDVLCDQVMEERAAASALAA